MVFSNHTYKIILKNDIFRIINRAEFAFTIIREIRWLAANLGPHHGYLRSR